MAQAPVVLRLIEAGGCEELVGPAPKVVAVGGTARPLIIEGLRGQQQRVARLLGRRQALEQQALPNAHGRDHDVLGSTLADDFFQHHGTKGQERAAGRGDGRNGTQAFHIDAFDEAAESTRLGGRDHVAVHDV